MSTTKTSVVMYTTRYCPFCIRAKMLLEQKGVGFEEISVDTDPALRQEMIQKSQSRTVPQIFIGDVHVGGCDDLFMLESLGKLDDLLKVGV